MSSTDADGREVRVLMSFRKPRATSNPYLPLLWAGLEETPGVVPCYFSWKQALAGSWDVLHVQWPETLLGGRSWWRRRVNELRYATLLARVRLTRRGLVRTAHNIGSHTPTTALGAVLVRATERWATQVITLNDTTPVRAGVTATLVPHGHYRDWYRPAVGVRPEPRRVLFFGLIRPYKGLEELVTAVLEASEADLELRVVGAPADPALAAWLDDAAAPDPRISTDFRHLDDDELAAEIAAASLVVLPYRELHNSGALLLALSLDRPVLVPAGVVADQLAAEVGEEWVRRFDGSAGPVSVDAITAALTASGTLRGRPDMSARDWATTAVAHRNVYLAAAGRRPAEPS